MRITIALAGTRETAAHPTLSGLGLAVGARPAPGGALALISFRAPRAVAHAYRRLHEALAILVDAPAEGLCTSSLLVDGEVHREPREPNWRGRLAANDGAPSWIGGAATVRITVEELTRPTTLYVRAALRDMTSPACAVELAPSGAAVEA